MIFDMEQYPESIIMSRLRESNNAEVIGDLCLEQRTIN